MPWRRPVLPGGFDAHFLSCRSRRRLRRGDPNWHIFCRQTRGVALETANDPRRMLPDDSQTNETDSRRSLSHTNTQSFKYATTIQDKGKHTIITAYTPARKHKPTHLYPHQHQHLHPHTHTQIRTRNRRHPQKASSGSLYRRISISPRSAPANSLKHYPRNARMD